MTKHIAIVAAIITTTIAALPASAQDQGEIRFTVTNLESDDGMFLCALFNAEESWLSEARYQTARATVRDGRATCVFRNLPVGTYAISAFHDQNGDARMDTGAFGIPSEPWCASRNARRPFGPPRFSDASFSLDGTSRRLLARAR